MPRLNLTPRRLPGAARRVGLLGLVWLAGCTLPATPIPFTPLQLMSGQWPPAAVAVANNVKDYTVTDDLFSYPAVGFSIKRATANDWLFQPSNNAVAIVYRVTADQPQPTLAVSLVGLPANANFEAIKQADKTQLINTQSLVPLDASPAHAKDPPIQVTTARVSGVSGEAWDYKQKDPTSGVLVRTRRIYVLDGRIVALIQAVASDASFGLRQPAFEQMIASVVLPPLPPNADGSAQPGPSASPTAPTASGPPTAR